MKTRQSPMLTGSANPTYHGELGDGLLVRWSTSDDLDALEYLVGSIFRDHAEAPFNISLQQLIRELMSGTHPSMGPGDFAFVEDRNRPEHPLVACTCLWKHTWEYEGIPFGVGEPEIVGSDPAYRRRGLIRALFEMIHERSRQQGHLAQAIAGIPYFYRLFGYEYALDLGGSYAVETALLPPATEHAPESFSLRDATEEDLPVLQHLYDQRRATGMVSLLLNESWWRYHLASWPSLTSEEHWRPHIINDSSSHPQGYVITQALRRGNTLQVVDLGFAHGVNVPAITPSLLHYLTQLGKQTPSSEQSTEPFSRINFELGRSHPLYDVLGKQAGHVQEAPYAWYVRVADLPGFLRQIAPALERRLAASILANYSGELICDFYQDGLRLVFEQGMLSTVESWQSPLWNARPDGRFPPLLFTQLLFGFRSLEELQATFPDVRVTSPEKRLLINALFPARTSWVPG